MLMGRGLPSTDLEYNDPSKPRDRSREPKLRIVPSFTRMQGAEDSLILPEFSYQIHHSSPGVEWVMGRGRPGVLGAGLSSQGGKPGWGEALASLLPRHHGVWGKFTGLDIPELIRICSVVTFMFLWLSTDYVSMAVTRRISIT